MPPAFLLQSTESEATPQKTPSIPGTLPEPCCPTFKNRYKKRGPHVRKYARACVLCGEPFLAAMPGAKYCDRICNARAYYNRRMAKRKAQQP